MDLESKLLGSIGITVALAQMVSMKFLITNSYGNFSTVPRRIYVNALTLERITNLMVAQMQYCVCVCVCVLSTSISQNDAISLRYDIIYVEVFFV